MTGGHHDTMATIVDPMPFTSAPESEIPKRVCQRTRSPLDPPRPVDARAPALLPASTPPARPYRRRPCR